MGSNPLRTVLSVATLGASEMIYRAEEANQQLGKMQDQAKPPTIEDAKNKVAPMAPKTYGRSGTIMNAGGQVGLASSTLNLTSPTLLGK